jgi:hypothetical protein
MNFWNFQSLQISACDFQMHYHNKCLQGVLWIIYVQEHTLFKHKDSCEISGSSGSEYEV